ITLKSLHLRFSFLSIHSIGESAAAPAKPTQESSYQRRSAIRRSSSATFGSPFSSTTFAACLMPSRYPCSIAAATDSSIPRADHESRAWRARRCHSLRLCDANAAALNTSSHLCFRSEKYVTLNPFLLLDPVASNPMPAHRGGDFPASDRIAEKSQIAEGENVKKHGLRTQFPCPMTKAHLMLIRLLSVGVLLVGVVRHASATVITVDLVFPFSVTEGSNFSDIIATFGDDNPAASPTDFNASIDWGDGTSLTAGAVNNDSGLFSVSGSHTYADEGAFTVTVTINDNPPGTGTATATFTATATEGDALSGSPVTFFTPPG